MAQDTRIEIKLNRIPNNVEVISLNEKGFILLYSGGERRGNSYNSWNITRFNKNFEEQWNKLVDIPSRFTIQSHAMDTIGQRLVWISESSNQLRLDVVDLKDGLNGTQTYSLGRHAKEVVSQRIVGDDLLILFKYGPDEQASGCFSMCCFPVAFPLNLAGLSIFKYGSLYTKIDLAKQIKFEREDVSKGISIPDKIQNNLSDPGMLSISSYKRKPHDHGKTSLEVKKLNRELETEDSFQISSPESMYLQNVQLVNTANGYAGVGTFNNESPEPNEDINNINALGFYTCIVDSMGSLKNIKLIAFQELASFNSYLNRTYSNGNGDLSEKQLKRLKRRYRNFSTLLHFNEITERENDFIATAEAFYPVYSSYRDANGNLIQYFEGYNYTHALIICFDKNGNLKWDKTIPLNFNRLYLNIYQKIKVLKNDEFIQLSYGSGGSLNVMDIVNDTISEPRNLPMPRLFAEDEKASEYIADVTPWYGQKYLVWGAQRIKKSDNKSREGNNVIYLDELSIPKR